MDTRTNGTPRTREPQYQFEVDLALRHGIARLGIMTNQRWRDDPRGLLFILARYKFVAKMLAGKARVAEVGCADAFGTRVVQQEVGSVTATDFDPVFLDDARRRMAAEGWACATLVHDILTGPVPPGGFDAAYSFDNQKDVWSRSKTQSPDTVVDTATVDASTPAVESAPAPAPSA